MRGSWRRHGEGPWPWLAAGSVALSLLMLLALLLLLATRGLSHFWPAEVAVVTPHSGSPFAGIAVREETIPGDTRRERLYFTANRDLEGGRWRWVELGEIAWIDYPAELVMMERSRWGDLVGRLVALEGEGESHVGEAARP
ncbi:MAG TPA: phosphate ABC transporter, permease protein PstA, partial [Halomonas sp.]|nr:phosphate ABC transporter, permease protein PstA [Halomonas sp.]